MKLYLNGLALDGPKGSGPYLWNGSTDDLLTELQQDWYCLEAVAVDKNGFVSRKEIYINVGNDKRKKEDWKFETYNLVEPVSVLWSSRRWDADDQEFKRKSPAQSGFKGPFEFVVTRGKKLAITGIKNEKRRVAWFANPNHEDWTGRFSK